MADNFEIPRYIAVEGVIGVGKTSFAEALAAEIGATLELDQGYDNPFLADFYRNQERHAFTTQLFFLLSRFQRQQGLRSHDLFSQRIVADYIFARDSLFASVTLTDLELALYEKIMPILAQDIPKPELVIYLQASTEVLLERIRIRNIKAERAIGNDYIDKLCDAYNQFFFHYTDTPLLVVKTDNIDFVNEPDHLADIVKQLNRPIHGKRYYSPSPSPELDYGSPQ
jgi:deoxyadenosine/deoxycytidine kinase